VIVNGLPDDPIEKVAESIRAKGGEAVAHAGDVSTKAPAWACIELATTRFGALDVLVNNAGVFLDNAMTEDYPIDDFDRTIRMNIRSAFLMTRFALPHLQKTKGNIVSAGSEAGKIGPRAEHSLRRHESLDAFLHARRGAWSRRATACARTAFAPGPIDTAWTHKETGPMDKEMETMLIQASPLARRGTTEEVANVYAFLASDEASYVTGALYMVDGGISIAKGPVGDKVSKSDRKQPAGELDLDHERDGLKNKDYQQIK
jgi:NAD(P)-dependent dehydrogenase (short-subunit alcohol dehydrogenase family)